MVGQRSPSPCVPDQMVVSDGLDPVHVPYPNFVGGEMLGFNEEVQGCLSQEPLQDHGEVQDEEVWKVEWWDTSQEDRTKGKASLHPFEETGW